MPIHMYGPAGFGNLVRCSRHDLWRSVVLLEKHDITVEICPIFQSCSSSPYKLHGNFHL